MPTEMEHQETKEKAPVPPVAAISPRKGLWRRLGKGCGVPPPHVEPKPLAAMDTSWAAWRFVLASFFLDTFIWGGTFAYGTWQEFYVSERSPFFGTSAVTLSAIGTTALALNYGEMLMGILLCRKYPHLVRRGIWVSLVVYVVSMFIASFATQVWMLILFQGVFVGAAGGLLYAPLFIYLTEWFADRRALAGGCIFAGAGAGGFIFPLVLNALLPAVGFRWTLRIFALLSAIFCGTSLLYIKPRLPLVKPVPGVRAANPIEWKFVYDSLFLCVCVTVLLQGFMYSSIIVYLSSYTTSFATPLASGLVLSVLNAASVPGQILTGALCDRFPYTRVQAVSGSVCTICIFALLRVADTLPRVMGFAVLIGLIGGGFTSSWFPACVDIAGQSHHQAGPIFGYLGIVRGIASIVGPILAGLVYDPNGTANASWGRFGLGTFVIFVGWMAAGTTAGAGAIELARRLRGRGKEVEKEGEKEPHVE